MEYSTKVRRVVSGDKYLQEYPKYKTVNEYYNKWNRSGLWQKINDELVAKCRLALGEKIGSTYNTPIRDKKIIKAYR